jgi:hypothetical protein
MIQPRLFLLALAFAITPTIDASAQTLTVGNDPGLYDFASI